jgi:myo-inositol-1(or 4)-monophosphatase
MSGAPESPDALEITACDAARAAGRVLSAWFRRSDLDRPESKGLHDFVTVADREAEAAVVSVLRSRHPGHAIMAEEGAPAAARSGYRWIVDPLDGTTNFIHGVTPFAVSVAVEDGDGIVAGAVHDPVHGETFHAHRGGGARLDGSPIRCSSPAGTGDALLATGFPFRELGRLSAYLRAFEAVVRRAAGVRRAGSAAIDLARTACGRYDGFFELGLSRWDVAAGILLVREAGGVVTDWGGEDRALDTGDIVAAGPALHATLVEITVAAIGRGD